MTDSTGLSEPPRHRLYLIGLVLGALVIRAWYASVLYGTIHQEGTYYARLAQNLAEGRGLVGMYESGLQLFFPLLYPFLIAIGTVFGGDGEAVGRGIAVLAGAATVLPVYGVMKTLWTPGAALFAAGAVALHPGLVGISAGVYSEPVFTLFVLSGAYYCVRASGRVSHRSAALAGIFFGLAYLTRQEALLISFVAICCISIEGGLKSIRSNSRAALVYVGALLIFVTPYVILLWWATGTPRLEAKSADNVYIKQLAEESRNGAWAYAGLDETLHGPGVNMMSDLDVIKRAQVGLQDLIGHTLEGVPGAVRNVERALVEIDAPSGGPLLLGFAFLGAFGQPWRRNIVLRLMLLMAVPVVAVLGLAAVPLFAFRFVYSSLVVLVMFAAVGLVGINSWADATFRNWNVSRVFASVTSRAIACGCFALLMVVSFLGARDEPALRAGDPALRAIGQRFQPSATSDTRLRIMDTDPIVPFYANAVHVPMPLTTRAVAERYVIDRNVDFVVVRKGAEQRFSYLTEWLANQTGQVAFERWDSGHDVGGEVILHRLK